MTIEIEPYYIHAVVVRFLCAVVVVVVHVVHGAGLVCVPVKSRGVTCGAGDDV